MFEAADAGIELIVCLTEGIPVQDMMQVRNYLDQKGIRLVGPNCPGLITPGEVQCGHHPRRYHHAGQCWRGLPLWHPDL